MNRPVCVHCELRKPNGTRRLCRTCMATPCVRQMYPPAPKFAAVSNPGYGLTGSNKPPKKPTTAPVGSVEKLKVMRARARAGVSLFHPDDSKEVQPCELYLTRPPRLTVKRRSRRPSRFGLTPTG